GQPPLPPGPWRHRVDHVALHVDLGRAGWMEDVVRGMTEGKGRAREVGVARPPERGGDLGGAPKLAGVDHHVRVRVETRALHRVNELRQVETLEQERLNSRIVPRGEERS